MTDKQIIVDGIDVSGCEYYFDEKCRCMDASIMQDFYLCPQCNSNPNCYYKQFKRSEAQCESMFVTHTDLEMKYKAKEQECEDLREELEWLHNLNDKIKTENEELKRQLEVKGNILTLIDESKNEYLKENEKLKQALTEIKEFVENEMEQDINTKIILQKCEDVL